MYHRYVVVGMSGRCFLWKFLQLMILDFFKSQNKSTAHIYIICTLHTIYILLHLIYVSLSLQFPGLEKTNDFLIPMCPFIHLCCTLFPVHDDNLSICYMIYKRKQSHHAYRMCKTLRNKIHAEEALASFKLNICRFRSVLLRFYKDHQTEKWVFIPMPHCLLKCASLFVGGCRLACIYQQDLEEK